MELFFWGGLRTEVWIWCPAQPDDPRTYSLQNRFTEGKTWHIMTGWLLSTGFSSFQQKADLHSLPFQAFHVLSCTMIWVDPSIPRRKGDFSENGKVCSEGSFRLAGTEIGHAFQRTAHQQDLSGHRRLSSSKWDLKIPKCINMLSNGVAKPLWQSQPWYGDWKVHTLVRRTRRQHMHFRLVIFIVHPSWCDSGRQPWIKHQQLDLKALDPSSASFHPEFAPFLFLARSWCCQVNKKTWMQWSKKDV